MDDYNSKFTGPEIDDAIARALPGGGIDTLLAGKEPAFTTLPISKGGTGANSVKNARANLGIDKLASCPAGGSISLTLPNSGVYLIGVSDNARTGGLIIVYTSSLNAQNNVQKATTLDTPISWSYSIVDRVLTLSETGGKYSVDFSIVTLCTGKYQYEVYS